jgi:hypothetical protein
MTLKYFFAKQMAIEKHYLCQKAVVLKYFEEVATEQN